MTLRLLATLLWIGASGLRGPPVVAQELPDTVDVAVLEAWPPHYDILEDGTPTGFGVEVMRTVAEEEGLTIRFVSVSTFPDAIEALADGSVDVIPDFGVTSSREGPFLFTRPFAALDISVFVRASDPATQASDEFEGRRIGIVRSNVGVELAATRYPQAERVVYENVREVLFELIAARVDAVVYPEEVFLSLARSAGLEDRFRVLRPPLAEVLRGMGVRPEDTALLATLNRGLDSLVGTEEYEAMVRRWLEPPEAFWTMRRVFWLGGILLLSVFVGMAIWRYRSLSNLAAELTRVLEERDAARETSRQEEERFRTVVETAYEGIVVVDSEGRITFVNRRLCELVGVEEEDLLRKDLLTHVHPDDHGRIREGMVHRQDGISESYEIRIQRADGDQLWVLLSVAPLAGADGEFAGSVATLADITARIEADRELEERERRFRSFVEKASDLISTLDAEGLMGYQSPSLERILGYEPDDLRGRSLFDLVHPDDREMVEDTWSELMEAPGTSVQIGPFRLHHKDGSWRTMTATLTNLLDDPSVGAIVSNAHDVTEQQELARQLRQSQKMEAVGRLAGGIAHDFNNLLTVIRSETDLILLDLEGGSPLAKEVELIQTAADRAATLTSQLLSFSREQVLQPRVTDLSSVVREVSGLLERVIGEDVRIDVDAPGGLPPVRVDPAQLGQVVLNLGINARDAMPDGGILTLSTYADEVDAERAEMVEGLKAGHYTVLCIADTGIGMDEETRARAFEPFFTTKGHNKGTGLGLAMTYGFVKQSGGTIHVESEPGEGTIFVIRFPTVDEELEATPPAARPSSEPRTGRGAILVVEDDDSVCRVAIKILDRAGFPVTGVKDAESAVELLEERDDVALILTDLVLPGMSGRELADRIRTTRPELPILVMSGYADDPPGHAGDLPADLPFLQKPFTPESLVHAVKKAL